MSTNFASLYPVAYNLGLGSGADGACHLMQIRLADLLPLDTESGRINGDDELNMYIYGTHVGFSLSNLSGEALANERTLHTIPELVSFLHSVYSKDVVVIEEDEELDAHLEAIREAALKADLVESDEDDDEFFEDEDGDEDIAMDDEEDLTADTDDEPVYITIAKSSAKANTKKFKKDLADTAAVLQEYFDEELAANGIDTEGLIEVLGAVFDEVAELEIDTGVSFFEQVSDYVELE
jgi:hypothetical protein